MFCVSVKSGLYSKASRGFCSIVRLRPQTESELSLYLDNSVLLSFLGDVLVGG